jgi:hypothetical protein
MNDGFLDDALFDDNLALFNDKCADSRQTA